MIAAKNAKLTVLDAESRSPLVGKLRELPFILTFRRTRQERPAPRSQAEIDRLAKGWEQTSQSTRAQMARIGI